MIGLPTPPVELLLEAEDSERVRELLALWLRAAAECSDQDAENAIGWAGGADGRLDRREALKAALGYDDAAASFRELASKAEAPPGEESA